MKNTDLFKLIGCFNKNEFANFGLFLNSSYHNSIRILVPLYEVLKNFHPDFESQKLTKEYIFGKLYNGKPYHDGVMRNLFSDLKKKAEEFMVIESFKNDSFQRNRIMLAEIRNRNLEKNFMSVYNSIKQDLNDPAQIDSEYFYRKYIAESELNSLLLENKISYKVETMSGNLEEMLNSMMHSVIAQTYRIYIQFSILKRGYKDFNFDFKFINEIESIFKKLNENSKHSFYIEFVHNAFKMFQTGDKKYFNRLMKIKRDHVDMLNDQDKANIYNSLIIFAYDYVVKGELEYIKILFGIMKEFVGKKLYREGNLDHIPEFAYLNVLSIGIFANEINWTEKFYKSHIGKLVSTNRTNLDLYSMALIAYSRNNFDEALEHLSRISTKKFAKIDIFTIKYKIKSLQLKIFYDMNHNDLFYSSLDSFKHFAYNDKLATADNRALVLDFIKFISKLFLLKNHNGKNISYEKMKLREDLLRENVIIDKIWLWKKLDEL